MAGNDKSRKTGSQPEQGKRTDSVDEQSPVPGQGAISTQEPAEGSRDKVENRAEPSDQALKRAQQNGGLSTQEPAEGDRKKVNDDLNQKQP
jgi:hypothetical protein